MIIRQSVRNSVSGEDAPALTGRSHQAGRGKQQRNVTDQQMESARHHPSTPPALAKAVAPRALGGKFLVNIH
jgi:hypothetical protein